MMDFTYSALKVLPNYIQNKSRIFYVFVPNHVKVSHDKTTPSQWKYINTARNPVDLATR